MTSNLHDSQDGDEVYMIHFKDLITGQLLDNETIRNVGDSLEWANDSKTVYYTILDKSMRAYKVLRHIIGVPNDRYEHDQDEEEESEEDEDSVDDDSEEELPNNHGMLVYHEKDRKFHAEVSKTLSERYLFIDVDSNVTSEAHFIDANEPSDPDVLPTIHPLSLRQTKLEYGATHWQDYFYIRENSNDAVNFRLIRVPINKIHDFKLGLNQDFVEVILEHDINRFIDYFISFKDHLAVFVREDGLPKLMILDHNVGGDRHYVTFPDPTYDLYSSDNETQDTTLVRIGYTSFTTPDIVYDYDMENRRLIKLKELQVLGEFDRSQYATERRLITARDGKTNIPISMVYKKTNSTETRPLVRHSLYC
jgi:oligopeptidase B